MARVKRTAPYAFIGALLVAVIVIGVRAASHSGTTTDPKGVATDVSSPRHPGGFRCSRKLHPAQAGRIAQALRNARPGAVICLTSGDYAVAGQIVIAGVTPVRNVTLRAAPRARVRLGMVFLSDVNRNLTIRGFSMNRVSVTGSASGLAFVDNTISHATSGFYFSAGPSETQTDIRVLYNRMDHLTAPSLGGVATAQCVTIAGSATEEHHFTVSHNTCGPGIGDHYFQVGGIDGLVADYNTFLGPPDNEVFTQGAHNNVLQIFGDSRNVDFSHNVMRDTESRGETVLIQEGHLDN